MVFNSRTKINKSPLGLIVIQLIKQEFVKKIVSIKNKN